MYELTVESGFSAAHFLVDYDGACSNLHGHNWKVQATIAADHLNELGMVMDLYELEKIVKSCLMQFDHKIINETEPFSAANPTSENLASHIYHFICEQLPENIQMKQVRLFETDNFSVTFRK